LLESCRVSTAMVSLLPAVKQTSTALRKLLLGRCWPAKVPNSARILVKTLDYDEKLKMHFPKYDAYTAHDPNAKCKVGDFVLIEQLPQRLTRDITHRVLEVIYPCGDVTDPITGKKCVKSEYRDEIAWKSSLWGNNPHNKFDYDKAPPRGSQEGIRDFSHKPGYRKWHEFLDRDQPEASR